MVEGTMQKSDDNIIQVKAKRLYNITRLLGELVKFLMKK